MSLSRTPRLPAAFASALSRSGVVWAFTVCFIYGPTGCTLGAATLLLLAGLPAVALATGLWLLAARRCCYRRRCARGGYLCARVTGALAGIAVPMFALAALPAAPGAVAAAVRLVLGTTALLTPVWVWLGSGFGTLLIAPDPARLSQPMTVRRGLSPSGKFVPDWA